jgi:hypothetical protein
MDGGRRTKARGIRNQMGEKRQKGEPNKGEESRKGETEPHGALGYTLFAAAEGRGSLT